MAVPIVVSSFQPIFPPIVYPVIGEITLKELFRTITIDPDTCITWIQQHGLLDQGMRCKCGSTMRTGKFAGISEEKGWRYPEKARKKFHL